MKSAEKLLKALRGGRIHRSRHHQVSSSGAIFRLGSLPFTAVRPPRLLRFAAHQPPFLDLSLCFPQWLASISRHLCQIKIKVKVFTKCAALVAGGAPPRHRPRKCSAAAVVPRADPTSQVQPTCLPSRLKHAEALKPSILGMQTTFFRKFLPTSDAPDFRAWPSLQP